MQTETPYWQPSPDAKGQPFPLNSAINDPVYANICPAGQICDALGLRIVNSQNIHMYGVGLYSFFKNYDLSCSGDSIPGGRRDCQYRISSIETSSGITAYSFNQVGALQMLTVDGQDKAAFDPNLSVYSNTIGLVTYKA
jgi:glucan 1,3-beta-glucosidase